MRQKKSTFGGSQEFWKNLASLAPICTYQLFHANSGQVQMAENWDKSQIIK